MCRRKRFALLELLRYCDYFNEIGVEVFSQVENLTRKRLVVPPLLLAIHPAGQCFDPALRHLIECDRGRMQGVIDDKLRHKEFGLRILFAEETVNLVPMGPHNLSSPAVNGALNSLII